jgi:hypothetical protein
LNGCPYDFAAIAATAAEAGDLALLRYFNRAADPLLLPHTLDNLAFADLALAAENAAKGGHEAIVDLLWKFYYSLSEWEQDAGVRARASLCAAAAGGGHLGLLQSLCAEGCMCDADTCSAAAESGDLETLAWVVEQLSGRDVPLPDTLLLDACRSGNDDTFRDVWLRRPYRQGRLSWTSHPDSSAYDLFLKAFTRGHLQLLRWMVESPLFTWLVDELGGEGREFCQAAAKLGHLDVLVWARAARMHSSSTGTI